MLTRMLSYRSVTVFLLVMGSAVGAVAQMPTTDGAVGPAVGVSLSRQQPRGQAIANLYDRVGWFRTAPLDVQALRDEDAQDDHGPRRMGIVQDLTIDSANDGQWTQLDDGGWLWTIRIQAPGAVAIRLRIDPWNPPVGAELTISTPDGSASWGPLTASFKLHPSRLWTPTLYTDAVHVDWYLPSQPDHTVAEAQLRITGLLNQYISPWDAVNPLELNCHNDATCDGTWDIAANGVGALASIGVNLPAGFLCSGAMLTRIPGDFARMFMTATHCGVTDANADTVEVTWFWQRTHPPVCPNGTVPNANTLPMTAGATVLAQDDTTDWTLIGLTTGVPGGLTWEGWDSNVLGNSSSVTGIHHPDGSWKRISYGTKTNNSGSRPNPAGGVACISGSSYVVQYRSDLGNGLTEPGSSGSPVFDSAQRVRGTLSCGSATCTGTSFSDYGRLDAAFSILAPYLMPADPVYTNVAYSGFESGTVAQPFNTVLEAGLAVISGHDVFVEAGSYNEQITIDRPMTLNSRNGTAVIGR